MTTKSFPQVGQLTANLPDIHMVIGRIKTDASATIQSGKGFTSDKFATGQFRVTLNKTVKIIATTALLGTAGSEARYLCKSPYASNVEGNNEVIFQTIDGSGSLADPSTGDIIEFCIFVMTVTGLPD